MSAIFEQRREEIANEIFARQLSALNNSMNVMKNVKGVSKIIIYGQVGASIAATDPELENKGSPVARR
ncbi:MAG TPA: hypothetical protein VMU10_10390 [Desulfomonilia bacterium]|nr:hypothetical protein [Desulfomonilia bacterium]